MNRTHFESSQGSYDAEFCLIGVFVVGWGFHMLGLGFRLLVIQVGVVRFGVWGFGALGFRGIGVWSVELQFNFWSFGFGCLGVGFGVLILAWLIIARCKPRQVLHQTMEENEELKSHTPWLRVGASARIMLNISWNPLSIRNPKARPYGARY